MAVTEVVVRGLVMRSTAHETTDHASKSATARRLVAVVLTAAAVVLTAAAVVVAAATTKQSTERTESATRLVAVTGAALLSTTEQRSRQLAHKVARSATAMS